MPPEKRYDIKIRSLPQKRNLLLGKLPFDEAAYDSQVRSTVSSFTPCRNTSLNNNNFKVPNSKNENWTYVTIKISVVYYFE